MKFIALSDKFGKEVANRFNIYAESIPAWLTEAAPKQEAI